MNTPKAKEIKEEEEESEEWDNGTETLIASLKKYLYKYECDLDIIYEVFNDDEKYLPAENMKRVEPNSAAFRRLSFMHNQVGDNNKGKFKSFIGNMNKKKSKVMKIGTVFMKSMISGFNDSPIGWKMNINHVIEQLET